MLTQTTSEPAATETPLAGYDSYANLMAAAETLFQARQAWHEALRKDAPSVMLQRKEQRYRQLHHEWHTRSRRSRLSLCEKANSYKLSRLEWELFWGVVSLHLGSGKNASNSQDITELLEYISVERTERLEALKVLNTSGRLITEHFLHMNEDLDGNSHNSELFPDPAIYQELLQIQHPETCWPLTEEAELYNYLRKLYRLLDRNADIFEGIVKRGESAFLYRQRRRLIDLEWNKVEETLKQHPDWSWGHPTVLLLTNCQRKILIVLAAVATGALSSNFDLFTGLGLISAICHDPNAYDKHYSHFRPDSVLIREQWIRPISESSEHYTGEDQEIETTRYELDDKAYLYLNIERPKKLSAHGCEVRTPKIRLEQLALRDNIRQALDLTITQARTEFQLLQEWGLADHIQYGLHPVLLFYGPPGTGKTATAEALAKELDRPLLIADYSQIQNCYVGMTEKNIVRVFQEAQRSKAVLFWDEADAMLFDRDKSDRTFEVRSVNVLLQQIERFEGVCILATNRRVTLDKALARRISMQVEFQRPATINERLQIWKAMIPEQLPLAEDVQFAEFAAIDLAGGEIKNIVVNAARFAATRERLLCQVQATDFRQAIDWELKARQERTKPIGF